MLSKETEDLLKTECEPHMSATHHVMAPVPRPSLALAASIEKDFVASGGTAGVINWITLLPKILELAKLAKQYGPQVLAAIQAIFALFSKPTPAPAPPPPVNVPPPGPVITQG